MKKRNFYLGVFIFSLFIFPKFVLALGQMTEPIIIDNALRGEKIQQELTAVNSDNSDIEVIFTAEGAIENWAKFYSPDDLNTPVDIFTLPASGNLRIITILEVPADIENGKYIGNLSVSNMANKDLEEGESGANVTQKIDRQVSVVISEEEEVNIEKTSVIPNKFDLESNEPLSIRVIYDNQGNVRLSPQIRIKIKKDDKNVHDLIYPYPEDENAVNSKSQYEISPIVIQTVDWESGKYFAFLEFYRGDEVLLQKDFMFSIMDDDEKSEINGGLGDYAVMALVLGLILIIIIWQVLKKLKN